MSQARSRRRSAGEGGVSRYQTKAGERWLIKYTATDANGEKKVVLRRGFLTRKAATTELGDVLAETRKGTHVAPQRKTVGEWLDDWLTGLQLAPSTRASYAKNVRLHLKPALGTVELQKLTGTRISAMYRAMETSGRKDHQAGGGLAPRTVRYVHTILHKALGEAVRQGLLASNPADRANPPSATAAQAPEMHPWSGTELSAFLEWCKQVGSQDAVAYRVLAYTGMRRGELLALRWRDLDADASRLAVRRSAGLVSTDGKKAIIEGPTKSGKPRVIDLDADTLDVLRKWRLERAKLSLQLVRDDALIFGTIEGDYRHPERFSRLFVAKVAQCQRALQADDARDVPSTIHLHDLRHTHATLLLKAGVPVKVVSERLGHSTVMITLEIYAHVMPGMQAEAAATFAALVSGGAS